jgi:hypothetical protein
VDYNEENIIYTWVANKVNCVSEFWEGTDPYMLTTDVNRS